MKISVIIPIYKVERFLPTCLDSIDHIRKCADVELILVDDGSPDNCGKICDDYASKHTDTKVIHKENGGLSSARNAGFDISQGEFIWFIDSDDFINEDIEDVIKMMKTHEAEMYCFGTKLCNEEGVVESEISRGLKNGVYKPIEIFRAFRFPFSGVPFSVFRRSVFDKLRFREGIVSEDWQFICRAFARLNTCYVIQASPYVYRIRNGSITNGVKSLRYVHDDVEIAQDFYNCILHDDIKSEGQLILYSGICSMLTSVRRLIFNEIKDRAEKRKSIDYFFSKHFWCEALDNAGSWKQKLQYLMLLVAKQILLKKIR